MFLAFWMAVLVTLISGGTWYGYQQHWQGGSWLIPVTAALCLLVLGRRSRNRGGRDD